MITRRIKEDIILTPIGKSMVEGCNFVREYYPSTEKGYFEKNGEVMYRCITEDRGGLLNSSLWFCALAKESKTNDQYEVIDDTRWTQDEIDRYKAWYDKAYPSPTGDDDIIY